MNHIAVHREQLLQAALDTLSRPPQGLPGLHQRCTGMIANVSLLINRTANFAQQNTEISQPIETPGHQQPLLCHILCIAAQPLHTLQTGGNIEKLRRIEVKPIDRGHREIRMEIDHSGDRRGRVNRQLFRHFRRFTLLHHQRLDIGNRVELCC